MITTSEIFDLYEILVFFIYIKYSKLALNKLKRKSYYSLNKKRCNFLKKSLEI